MSARDVAARWFDRWALLWDQREDPVILAVIRVAVASVLLFDLGWIAHLGIVDVLFTPQEGGGLPDVLSRDPVPELYRWFPSTPSTAWMAYGTLVGALVCFGAGFLTPVSGLVAVLVSAQLAQVLPLGDRGIDTLLRNVILVLSFSSCGRRLGVDALLFGVRRVAPAWPRHLLILQLSVVYFCAGIQKTALAWTPLGGLSALFLILQDPSIAAFRFDWLAHVYPLTQLATGTTMVFEWSACLLPLVYWYRYTRAQPGRLRAWFNAYRPLRAWVLLGVGLHAGIALTMSLGIFPFAMLALYPALLHPDELWRLLGRGAPPALPRPREPDTLTT